MVFISRYSNFMALNFRTLEFSYINRSNFSCDKIENNKVGGACSTYGERRGIYRVLVGKPEGKKPLGRPRRKWEDNIKTNIQEMGCGVMGWIELAQDRDWWRALVNAVMNLGVP